MSRTMEDIQKDYNQQAAILGQVEYQLDRLEVDKHNMLRKMRQLNKEAQDLQAKQQREASPQQEPADAAPQS